MKIVRLLSLLHGFRLFLLAVGLVAICQTKVAASPQWNRYLDQAGFFEFSMLQTSGEACRRGVSSIQRGDLVAAAQAFDESIAKRETVAAYAYRSRLAILGIDKQNFIRSIAFELSEIQKKPSSTPQWRLIGIWYALSTTPQLPNEPSGASLNFAVRSGARSAAMKRFSGDRTCLILQAIILSAERNQEQERAIGEHLVRTAPQWVPGYVFAASRYLSGHSARYSAKGQLVSKELRPDFHRAEELLLRAIKLDPLYARSWYVKGTIDRNENDRRADLLQFLKLAPKDHPKYEAARKRLKEGGFSKHL